MSKGCECIAANRSFLEEKWHKQEYFYHSVGGGLCYGGGANLSLLMRNFRVRRVAPSWPVYLPVCVMHWRAFRGCCLRMESEVGESGRALMDGLHGLPGGDRLDFWWAAALRPVVLEYKTIIDPLMCVYIRGLRVPLPQLACSETIPLCSRAPISTPTKSHKTSRKPKRYPSFCRHYPPWLLFWLHYAECQTSTLQKFLPTQT